MRSVHYTLLDRVENLLASWYFLFRKRNRSAMAATKHPPETTCNQSCHQSKHSLLNTFEQVSQGSVFAGGYLLVIKLSEGVALKTLSSLKH